MMFSKSILEWYDANRRELPWRGETDPYRIWISEIMLQQTRAETVQRRYDDFLRRFPDVFALAGASEEEVLKAWEGLGYYARARNLHKAARIVAYELHGALPNTAEELRKLPGVGAYAACSIASIAFGQPVPALDANLARVFSRVTGRREPLSSPAELYPRALEYMDAHRPGDFNQALMDIGAMLCMPQNPRCEKCPAQGMCVAAQSGSPEDFPGKAPKPIRREERRTVVLALCDGKLLLRRRPASGLLGGLWEFPALEGWPDAGEISDLLQRKGFADVRVLKKLPAATHTFTHLTWRMQGMLVRCGTYPEGYVPADAAGLNALAMPSALRVYRREGQALLEEQ